MKQYSEFTDTVAKRVDSLVDRVQKSQVDAIHAVGDRVDLESPELVQRVLKSLREIATANYKLRRRLNETARDYSLSLIDALTARPPRRKGKAKAA